MIFFFACFCAYWDISVNFFIYTGKVGEALAELSPSPEPTANNEVLLGIS